jgi:type IV pilus assembly protein PilQ
MIVKDIPRNIPAVKSLVKSLDTKTPQVLIEARIVEANLTFQKELGVRWGFLIGEGKASVKGGLPGNKLVDLPAATKTGTAGILEMVFSRGTIRELDVAISAHENQGNVKIISSPKIAVLDNKEASIEQGVRLPIPKIDPQSGQISIEYVEANLKLLVTPHVTNDGHIKMIIKVKKDAPDYGNQVQNVPSIDKKEAVTEVLVKDDGVAVIAGVYSIEKSESDEGIPLFGKIPLLGWLFKREAKEDKRRDLLIFISPKIFKDQI